MAIVQFENLKMWQSENAVSPVRLSLNKSKIIHSQEQD